MKLEKKKMFNFRFVFFVAVMMIVSIIFGSCIFVSQKSKLALILLILGVFLIFLICFALFKKRILLTIAVIVLSGIIPATSIYFKAQRLDDNQKLIASEFVYSGKIYKISKRDNDKVFTFYLTDVKVIYEDDEEKDFYGDVYVRLYADGVDTSKLNIGTRIYAQDDEFRCLSLNEKTSKFDRSLTANGVTATSFLFSYNYIVGDELELNARDKIKAKVYSLFDGTNTEFTEIGYAMMFGESNILDGDIHVVFKNSGTAHLLAVSGFHVSVIVAFLNFILNKLKANKYVRISVIGLLLLGYAYLCSFSVSVVRASIMSLLFIYATMRNREYDRLSALSLSAIVLFLMNPMKLFSVSFIFSFVSILSIILLVPLFERVLSKILGEKLCSSLSMSMAVSVGILVFQTFYFGSYHVLSVISNIITIPIVGVLFIYLIVSVLVSLVIAPLAVPLINLFGTMMKYVVQINNWIASSGLFLTPGELGVLTLVVAILLMFVSSDYVFLNKKLKYPISGVLLATIIALMIW